MPSFCLEMILAFTCIAIFYAIMIMAFAYYWRDDSDLPKIGSQKLVSVIVAFRNEEKNLKTLIDSLLSQSHKNCEFIFINDGSDDNFEEIFAQYNDSRIICKTLNAEKSGKKAALKYGSEISSGEILYFTDGDCKLQPDCIRIMLSEMQEQGIAMLCGPVCFAKRKGFMNKIFRLEFLSLTGSGAAGFFMKRPFMCNGANFMVERKVYAEADLNEKYS
ncbi:MAG: glycosyltransferase, partial [Bacteroidales bacterium]|nr:glycosyltransferase [Bacteroidales bacterium]